MYSTRATLRLNALTCALFGMLFVISPTAVSTLLGQIPSLVLIVLGVGLIAHASHLLLVSFKKTISKLEVYYFSTGDQAWFLASMAVLLMTEWISTSVGVWATTIVAVTVSLIGLAQVWTYAESAELGVPSASAADVETDSFLMPANLSRWKAIGVSWLGIKTWVKIWLLALNSVFLAAFLFLPSKLALVTLVASAACLPLLLSFMIVQRGLTRLLGLAHLIPWTPLLIYLFLRLATDTVGAKITSQTNLGLFTFSIVLFVCITVCLVFDIYDLVRWGRGHRGRLGSVSEGHEHTKVL